MPDRVGHKADIAQENINNEVLWDTEGRWESSRRCGGQCDRQSCNHQQLSMSLTLHMTDIFYALVEKSKPTHTP